jgi:hypothetical protein
LNNAKLNALFDANKSLAVTPIGTLPPSGSASYNGFAELVSPASVMTGTTGGSAVGVAALEVDFGTATNAMTGTITDFDDTTGTYDGTLNVTGGSISSITGNLAATSDIAGTLTRSSGEVINVAGKVGGGVLRTQWRVFARLRKSDCEFRRTKRGHRYLPHGAAITRSLPLV